MNYTITSMTNFGGNQIISVDKNGSKYSVGFYDKETQSFTHKDFNSIGEAEAAFMKMASFFIRGMYSAEQRANFLKEM